MIDKEDYKPKDGVRAETRAGGNGRGSDHVAYLSTEHLMILEKGSGISKDVINERGYTTVLRGKGSGAQLYKAGFP